MQRLAHARRLRARNELAEQDDALGVGRPLRRLLAERRVERIDERFGGRGHRGLLPCVHRRPPLERSLPPSYAPRVLAFKLDLDAFLYLRRSCPCQTEQPSELFIFRVSAPDEGQHGRERSSGKVGKRRRGGSHRCRRNPLWHSTKWKRFRHGTRSQIR